MIRKRLYRVTFDIYILKMYIKESSYRRLATSRIQLHPSIRRSSYTRISPHPLVSSLWHFGLNIYRFLVRNLEVIHYIVMPHTQSKLTLALMMELNLLLYEMIMIYYPEMIMMVFWDSRVHLENNVMISNIRFSCMRVVLWFDLDLAQMSVHDTY